MKYPFGSNSEPQSEAQRYALRDWNIRASVRASQYTYSLPADLQEQLENRRWFPAKFLPYLDHPAINCDDSYILHRLSANHLVHFLDYTTILEHRIVNRSVEVIAHNELNIFMPLGMKTAALQLYTDEGYHALFSSELAEQIAEFYGMTDRPVMPRRITDLSRWIECTPEQHKNLAWFLVGFVSETIIAKELLEVCRNELVSSVENMLRDHLNDEARHSRYFCEVFHFLWSHLQLDQRTFAAYSLLEILLIFFEVDEAWLCTSLRSVGLAEMSITQILCDQSAPNKSLCRIRSGARATLSALTQSGFFDVPANRKLFSEAGLIDG